MGICPATGSEEPVGGNWIRLGLSQVNFEGLALSEVPVGAGLKPAPTTPHFGLDRALGQWRNFHLERMIQNTQDGLDRVGADLFPLHNLGGN